MSPTTVCFRHDDAVDLFFGRNGSNFGGAETQIYLIAKMLAEHPDYDVLFLTEKDVPDVCDLGVRFAKPQRLISRGLPLVSRRINRKRSIEPFAGCDRVVLFQTIAGANTIAMQELSQRLGYPFISRISSDADIDGSLVPSDSRGHYFRALCSADAVVAQSTSQKERLSEELGIQAQIVPSIVDVEPVSEVEASDYILWVGRKVSLKRPWLFLETARRYPQYKFVMVGPDYDPMLSEALLDEVRHMENVEVVSEVPFHSMSGYFRGARLVVGTSLVEGFPNVYLQAAAHAVPVVSLSVPTSIYPDRGGCGFDAEGDFSRFWATLERWMCEDESRRSAGAVAREYVIQEHSVEAVGGALFPLLDRLTSASR